MDGLYFDDSMEPDDEIFRLRNAVEDLANRKGVKLVTVKCDNKEDFYSTMNAFRHFTEDNIKVFMSSNDDNTIIVKKDDGSTVGGEIVYESAAEEDTNQ